MINLDLAGWTVSVLALNPRGNMRKCNMKNVCLSNQVVIFKLVRILSIAFLAFSLACCNSQNFIG